MARIGALFFAAIFLLGMGHSHDCFAAGRDASAPPAKSVPGAPKGGKRANTAPVQTASGLTAASFKFVKLPPPTPEETAALREASTAYGKRDYAKAVSVLTPFAEGGSPRAAFSLGLMAMRGHGMLMSTEMAEKWWIRSAQGGFPDAQYHLGFMYHQGLRGARNPEVIARLWSLAAEQGQGDAVFGLGYMYRAGDGVPRDIKKSAKMFMDAAKMGHPGAAYELGLMYKYGRAGVAKDTAKARENLQKAVDAGIPQAKQELAGIQ